MKVMRRQTGRRGYMAPSGAGGFYNDSPSPSHSWLFGAAEAIFFFFLVLPEYFGANMPFGILIAIRAVISLTALSAFWFFCTEEFPKSTRLLFTAEVILLWFELIPGCMRPALLMHLIIFLIMIVDLFFTKQINSISKSGLYPYISLALRLAAFSTVKITTVSGSYLTWAIVIGILCGIISTVVLILHRQLHPVWCVLSALPIALISFLFIQSTVELLNFSMDFSEPEHHTVVLEEIDHNHRAPDDFIVTIKRKKLVLNSSTAQNVRYNKGDTLTVLEYDGAFGIAYYMIED